MLNEGICCPLTRLWTFNDVLLLLLRILLRLIMFSKFNTDEAFNFTTFAKFIIKYIITLIRQINHELIVITVFRYFYTIITFVTSSLQVCQV